MFRPMCVYLCQCVVHVVCTKFQRLNIRPHLAPPPPTWAIREQTPDAHQTHIIVWVMLEHMFVPCTKNVYYIYGIYIIQFMGTLSWHHFTNHTIRVIYQNFTFNSYSGSEGGKGALCIGNKWFQSLGAAAHCQKRMRVVTTSFINRRPKRIHMSTTYVDFMASWSCVVACAAGAHGSVGFLFPIDFCKDKSAVGITLLLAFVDARAFRVSDKVRICYFYYSQLYYYDAS